jgi:predicted GIY-YIG superfamily endonuclease
MAWCYLIHFESPPRGRSQHYIGYTGNVRNRWKEHCSGQGSDLTKLAKAQGIEMELVRVWANASKKTERYLKDCGGKSLCPVCMAAEVQRTLNDLSMNGIDT